MAVPEPITAGRSASGVCVDALPLFDMGPLIVLLLGGVLPVVLEPAHPLLAAIVFSWMARCRRASGRGRGRRSRLAGRVGVPARRTYLGGWTSDTSSSGSGAKATGASVPRSLPAPHARRRPTHGDDAGLLSAGPAGRAPARSAPPERTRDLREEAVHELAAG
jgi:hypothetical protein